ncbi:hypothetical protein Tco_0286178 [Tanacetum coccineum]
MKNCRFALLSLSPPQKLQSCDSLGVGRWCSAPGHGCVGDGCVGAAVICSGVGEGAGSGECVGEDEGLGEWEGEDVILEGEVEGSVTSSIVGNRETS